MASIFTKKNISRNFGFDGPMSGPFRGLTIIRKWDNIQVIYSKKHSGSMPTISRSSISIPLPMQYVQFQLNGLSLMLFEDISGHMFFLPELMMENWRWFQCVAIA